jgi:hypothetical protein
MIEMIDLVRPKHDDLMQCNNQGMTKYDLRFGLLWPNVDSWQGGEPHSRSGIRQRRERESVREGGKDRKEMKRKILLRRGVDILTKPPFTLSRLCRSWETNLKRLLPLTIKMDAWLGRNVPWFVTYTFHGNDALKLTAHKVSLPKDCYVVLVRIRI